MQTDGFAAGGSEPRWGPPEGELLFQRFARRLIHNLNNPLAGILGCAQLLDRALQRPEGLDAARCRGYVEMIQGEALACSRALQTLALVVRPVEAGPAPADTHTIIRETLDAFSCPPGVRAQFEPGARQPVASVDRDLMAQALLFVLQNAADALPGGGTITVRTADAGERLRITVSDTGPGIPPDALPRVTEPFFTTRQGHNGIGLTACQRIVACHGGELTIGAAAEGGARVTIELPRQAGA